MSRAGRVMPGIPIPRWAWLLAAIGIPCSLALAAALAHVPVVSALAMAFYLAGHLLPLGAYRRVAALQLAIGRDLATGDLESARARLAAKLGPLPTNLAAAQRLFGAAIELRAGDPDAAAALAASAVAISSDRGLYGQEPSARGVALSTHAIALAVSNRVDEASIVLTEPEGPLDVPETFAARSVAASLVALRTNKPTHALELLDSARFAVSTTMTGHDAALAHAIEALATDALGGVYRGAPRSSRRVLVDASERDYVVQLLPEAAPFLDLELWPTAAPAA